MFNQNPELIQELEIKAAPWLKVTPLVLLHDGGGTTFSYHLLKDLDRPVYGIWNPHYHNGETWESVPQMARHYAKLIKSVIPRGKLIIGGWSLGGMVSVEVARILADDPALNIIGIVMIDSVCPKALPTRMTTPSIAQHSIPWSPHTRQETRDKVMRCFEESGQIVRKWTLPTWGDENVDAMSTTSSSLNDDEDNKSDHANGFIHHTAARPSVPSGSPARSPPPVILLRATEPVPVVGEGVSRVDVIRYERQLGWDQYRPDLVTQVVDLPGCHHFDIFTTEEKLEMVTGKIRKACQDLQLSANRVVRRW